MTKYITFKIDEEFVKGSIDPLVSKEKGLNTRVSVIREALRNYRKQIEEVSTQ